MPASAAWTSAPSGGRATVRAPTRSPWTCGRTSDSAGSTWTTSTIDGYLRDRDVFADGITIEDNLAVVVDYAGGPTLNYSLNAHSPWEGYRVAVNGTEGRAELEVVERGAADEGAKVLDPSATAELGDRGRIRPRGERLLVQRHWEQAREVPIADFGGAHGGGDDMLLADLFGDAESRRG